ncbi:hypothetical protein O6P43_010525 [Quillaja saponaria]|uniref:Uncharacterized protein n=1 Tax=Quillaja saponaria TaxID=32244 RepID=A0AAD7Q0Q0_QUISA|nr:hypothetical protein O6P43_010525 [Quillaja saponaria]
MSQSFRRRFSQKSVSKIADNAREKLPEDFYQTPGHSVSVPTLKRVSFTLENRSHLTPRHSKLFSESAIGEKGSAFCASGWCNDIWCSSLHAKEMPAF